MTINQSEKVGQDILALLLKTIKKQKRLAVFWSVSKRAFRLFMNTSKVQAVLVFKAIAEGRELSFTFFFNKLLGGQLVRL